MLGYIYYRRKKSKIDAQILQHLSKPETFGIIYHLPARADIVDID